MNHRFFILLALVLLTSCASRSVILDKDLESIPKDMALEYLQKTSTKYGTLYGCIYTKLGITGTPYSEMEFQVLQNVWGNQVIQIWKKGGSKKHTNSGNTSGWVCNPIHAGGWDGRDYTKEEMEEVVNRTASALISLGVQLVK